MIPLPTSTARCSRKSCSTPLRLAYCPTSYTIPASVAMLPLYLMGSPEMSTGTRMSEMLLVSLDSSNADMVVMAEVRDEPPLYHVNERGVTRGRLWTDCVS